MDDLAKIRGFFIVLGGIGLFIYSMSFLPIINYEKYQIIDFIGSTRITDIRSKEDCELVRKTMISKGRNNNGMVCIKQ